MSNILNQQDTAEPMTKREQIAALILHKLTTSISDDAGVAIAAVNAADALLAELKRRKEQP